MTRKHIGALAVASGLFLSAWQAQASDTVHAGWDLFRTEVGTTFSGVPFQGVPLQTFDFGGSIGVKNVGDADTIIQRLFPAFGPGPTTIPIELLALQLVSVLPVDFGAGLGSYFITLQSARGGPASPGQMTIDVGAEGNPHGTFSSSLDVFFDLRFGSLSGPIILSQDLVLSSQGTGWSHEPIVPSLLIDGVNHNLDGTDILQDFWTPGVTETHPTGAQHVVVPAVPEASTYFAAFLTFGVMGGSMALRRFRGNC